MRAALGVALLLLMATPAAGQTFWRDARYRDQLLATRVPDKTERIWLKVCLGVNLAGAIVDGVYTYRALQLPNTRERNVVLAPFFRSRQRGPIILVKTGFAVGSNAIYIGLADTHPKTAATVACATGAVGLGAGIANARLILRLGA
jgi:hypothetical protein